MKIVFYLLTAILITSCGNSKDTISNEQKLISETEGEGYKYIGECNPPNGIRDTLLIGYTDRVDGVFHKKELRLKELTIKGYEFIEISDKRWKSKLMIYQFEFGNKLELEQFEEFQDYLLNYQRHSKNKVKFFQKDSKWFLRFEPMP